MIIDPIDINSISCSLESKKFSSEELTRYYLKKIKSIDKKIKAFVTVDEEKALKTARSADRRRSKGEKNILLGIPTAIKDNFCTDDLKTTASSRVLKNYIPRYDATVVRKIKKAGGVILGKTNMDAWAHGSSTETSDFFTTKNPWNTNKLPGGSSGGSAAAVIAGLVPYAVGSETAGSIRLPSSWCGVTGFKPTYGAVSRYGLIAMTSSTDSPGPICLCAQDCRTVFNIIAGEDEMDATSHTLVDKINHKKTIGIPKEYFLKQIDHHYLDSVFTAINVFKKKGYLIKEISLLNPKYSISVYTVVQRSEVSSNLSRFDGIRYGNNRSFFGEEAKRRIMLGTYSLSSGYYDQYYLKAQKVRTLLCQNFNQVFSQVDFIISPTTVTTALNIGATKDSFMFGELQDVLLEPSSLAGLPAISVPCGFSKDGLPYGMQIIGPQDSDYRVINLAIEYQRQTGWHTKKPKILFSDD